MVHVERAVPLAPHTTFGVGGPARYFTIATSTFELEQALRWAKREGIATFLLGGGSNLVVSDAGVDALVIQVALRGVHVREASGIASVRAAAGENWDDLVARTVAGGFAGLECLSGIPGAVGATPIQNVGAYGQEVGETITRLFAIDRETCEHVTIAAQDCAFAYRDSIFKRAWRHRFVIAEVEFELAIGGAPAIRYSELRQALPGDGVTLPEVRAKVIALRRKKSMVLDPGDENFRSAGSFFMNPIVADEIADRIEHTSRISNLLANGESMPRFAAGNGETKLAAGWLIERAGFPKGTSQGNVGLSTRHALAIVNRGAATAREIVDFARVVQDGVEARFGLRLSMEPELVGFS